MYRERSCLNAAGHVAGPMTSVVGQKPASVETWGQGQQRRLKIGRDGRFAIHIPAFRPGEVSRPIAPSPKKKEKHLEPLDSRNSIRACIRAGISTTVRAQTTHVLG